MFSHMMFICSIIYVSQDLSVHSLCTNVESCLHWKTELLNATNRKEVKLTLQIEASTST